MSQATTILITRALQHYAAECRGAEGRLGRAMTLRELKQAANVHPQSIIAAVHRAVPEHRRLQAAAERRAEEICRGHIRRLERLFDQGDTDSFELALSQYRHDEWQLLRGDYPRLVGYVERESRGLEHSVERATSARLAGPAPLRQSDRG